MRLDPESYVDDEDWVAPVLKRVLGMFCLFVGAALAVCVAFAWAMGLL